MKKERYDMASKLLEKYVEKNGLNGLIGVGKDPTSGEFNTLTISKFDPKSAEAQELKQAGYEIIYPASLKKEAVDKMDPDQQVDYESTKNTALIVDRHEENRTLDFAKKIEDHFFSNGDRMLGGIDSERNATSVYPRGDFEENVSKEYNDLLNRVGFTTEMDKEGKVTAFSNIPYPIAKRSKFREIYNSAKDKIQGMFAKIKSIVKPDKTKEDKQDVR